MELVVDTSVVVAALLMPSSTRTLLFNPSLKLCSPERLEYEIVKNKERFKEYSNLTEEQLFESLVLVLKQIEIIAFEEYRYLEGQAREACKRDESDWPFVALALHRQVSIWSNDPDLLEENVGVPVISTQDLINRIQ